MARFRTQYGERYSYLRHETPFQLLVAVVLSQQNTDAGVNKVTPALFAKYGTPEAMARARVESIRALIEPIRYAWTKAPRLKEMARRIVDDFGGEVPTTMEELTSLPGVGVKTASVVQGYVLGRAEAVAVDVHVGRVAYRLGLTTSPTNADRSSRELGALYLEKDWPDVNFYFIKHGRTTCVARRPFCGDCVVRDLCPRVGVTEARGARGPERAQAS